MSDWQEGRAEEAFIEALNRTLGERIRRDDPFAARAWGSVANVTWSHPVHGELGLSFRAMGKILSDIRGSGSYMDWYLSSPAGVVDQEFREAMAVEDWISTAG